MTAFICASDISVGEAALYALVGFLIVLAVLAVLVGIFYLSGFLFRTKALSRDKLFEFKKKPETPAADTDADVGALDVSDDEMTVAAISAAVSVILTEENGGVKPEFIIRRVTRK